MTSIPLTTTIGISVKNMVEISVTTACKSKPVDPSIWADNIRLRSWTALQPNRITRQVLPRLRVIVPEPVVMQPALFLGPLPLEADVAGDFAAIGRLGLPDVVPKQLTDLLSYSSLPV